MEWMRQRGLLYLKTRLGGPNRGVGLPLFSFHRKRSDVTKVLWLAIPSYFILISDWDHFLTLYVDHLCHRKRDHGHCMKEGKGKNNLNGIGACTSLSRFGGSGKDAGQTSLAIAGNWGLRLLDDQSSFYGDVGV